MKIAWGITGSGDFMSEIVKSMRQITKENEGIQVYVFMSRAAQQVLRLYGLTKDLENVSNKIFLEIDANRTEPFYYLPGALQVGKFKLFLICPATANTVAKIVNGIADSLITNAAAQAAKANVPIYIYPVDSAEDNLTTTLPDGSKLQLTMRKIDIENARRLSTMENFNVFTNIAVLKEIIDNHP